MLAGCMLCDALSQLLTCLSQLSEVLNNHGKEIFANQVATDCWNATPLECRLEWRCSSHTPETKHNFNKRWRGQVSFTSPSIFFLIWSYHAFGFGMFTLKVLQYFPNMITWCRIDVCNFVTLTLHPTFLNEVSLLHLIIDFELFSHFHLC
jgi:hypothetical protein